MDKLFITLTFVSLLGSGLIAGAFFAFSTFVMKALGKLPASSGIAAMQSINVVVINPMFLGVFLGTALACVVVMGDALLHWQKPGAGWVLAGGLLYLVGTFMVTMVGNVPLNNSLATISPTAPESATQWADYLSRWTMWNHVRTAAALGAMVAFVIGMRR